jgi:hypothetical protein
MPFPLAHPAAVLPLRRYCPRRLSFLALIIGSLTPDAGYLIPGLNLQQLSHQPLGAFVFCLPVGLLALLVFHYLRPLLVRWLPKFYRQALTPLCQRPLGSLLIIVVSMLIGIAAHQFLDSFTHKDGYLSEQLDFLLFPVYEHGHRTLRVCHVLWYLCSFLGITWVAVAYQEWLAALDASPTVASAGSRLVNGAMLAVAVLLLSVGNQPIHHWSARFWEGAFSLLVVAAFARRTGTLSRLK